MKNNNNLINTRPSTQKGIQGFLIFIVTWIAVTPINILINYNNLTEIRISMLRANQNTIPFEFFEVAYFGYMLLLPLSIIMIFAVFKQLKLYVYLEVLNLFIRSAFLLALYLIIDDISIIYNLLASYIFRSIIISFMTIIYLFVSKKANLTFTNTINSVIKPRTVNLT